MGEGSYALQISAVYNQFTKAEKKVADYVLKNPKKVVFMSITDLADACDVGDTSVYRFCRTLQLQGYQEFKMKLSLSLNEGKKEDIITQENTDLDESLKVRAEKILQSHLGAIKETYYLLDQTNFNCMVELFEKANRVYFFGIGDSLLIAQSACNKFMRITNKVICVTDSHMQAMSASMMDENDLLIIVSYSGATKDSIHVTKVAKNAGARIGCITRFEKSPLTTYCDSILLCGSNEGPLDGGSMSAKMSQLYIIDLLYKEYYARNHEACSENKKKTSSAVVEKLY